MQLPTLPRRISEIVLITLCSSTVFISCNSDDSFKTSEFTAINEAILFGSITPEIPVNAMEFRLADCQSGETFGTTYSEGIPCENAPDPQGCQDSFDTYRIAEGAGYGLSCLPACCVNYLIVERSGDIQTYESRESLLEFLGPIDSVSDALIWIASDGLYYSYNDVEASGFREMPDGSYRIIALETVAYCAPIITEQVLLEVAMDGTIEELARREYDRDENACI